MTTPRPVRWGPSPGPAYDAGMAGVVPEEILVALNRLIDQCSDQSNPVLSRISASITSHTYLEAITRALVEEALAEGSSWEEIAQVFGTSAVNVQARFGSYRSYDDDEDDDDGSS